MKAMTNAAISDSIWKESAIKAMELVTWPTTISTTKKEAVRPNIETRRHFFPLYLPIVLWPLAALKRWCSMQLYLQPSHTLFFFFSCCFPCRSGFLSTTAFKCGSCCSPLSSQNMDRAVQIWAPLTFQLVNFHWLCSRWWQMSNVILWPQDKNVRLLRHRFSNKV